MNRQVEKLLWTIAIPGFGQLLNGRYAKGILLIALEFLINVNAHLNQTIMYSFRGDIGNSLAVTDFQWLMFYPCVYMYAIWDAYRDAGGGRRPYAYLAFVLPAFLGTVGIMYSPDLRVWGYLLGPVWLPMMMAFVGIFFGIVIERLMNHRELNR